MNDPHEEDKAITRRACLGMVIATCTAHVVLLAIWAIAY